MFTSFYNKAVSMVNDYLTTIDQEIQEPVNKQQIDSSKIIHSPEDEIISVINKYFESKNQEEQEIEKPESKSSDSEEEIPWEKQEIEQNKSDSEEEIPWGKQEIEQIKSDSKEEMDWRKQEIEQIKSELQQLELKLLSTPTEKPSYVTKKFSCNFPFRTTVSDHEHDVNDQLCGEELKQKIKNLSSEKLEFLLKFVKPIFKESFENKDHLGIVKCFEGLPLGSWEKLGKQIQFLMPYHSEGKHIACVAQVLSGISSSDFCDLLVKLAHQYSDWNSESLEIAITIISFCAVELEILELCTISSFKNITHYMQSLRTNFSTHLHPLSSNPSDIFEKQVHFLLLPEPEDKDKQAISQILLKVALTEYKELLISTASRLYDWNMTNRDRIAILLHLSSLDSKKLAEINLYSSKEKTSFAYKILRG